MFRSQAEILPLRRGHVELLRVPSSIGSCAAPTAHRGNTLHRHGRARSACVPAPEPILSTSAHFIAITDVRSANKSRDAYVRLMFAPSCRFCCKNELRASERAAHDRIPCARSAPCRASLPTEVSTVLPAISTSLKCTCGRFHRPKRTSRQRCPPRWMRTPISRVSRCAPIAHARQTSLNRAYCTK